MIETRGKTRQDQKALKEDPDAVQDDQAGTPKHAEKKAARSPQQKRGRPRKAETKEAPHDDSDSEGRKAATEGEEEGHPKKTKQLKQVHDPDEVMNGNNHRAPVEDFEDFAMQLPSNMSVEEVQALLHENGLDTLVSDDQLYQRRYAFESTHPGLIEGKSVPTNASAYYRASRSQNLH